MKVPFDIKRIFLVAVLCAVQVIPVSGQKKAELAPAPIMGWNSWNWFRKDSINETIVREVIDAMERTGLRDLGYNYVVVDGGWRDVKLGEKGELLSHPEKFPSGMKALADYAHSKGFKFGVHTVPGYYDCGCDPVGGWGHEALQVAQFVDWGLDYIKLDRCRFTLDNGPDKGWSEENVHSAYLKWSKLLHDCGRDITFTICAYKFRDWYPDWCNFARTTGDIGLRLNGGAFFERADRGRKGLNSVMEIAEINNKWADRAGNGYWNDPDALALGEQGMTEEEQRAHFALWCIMSAPLILGNDPRNMQPYEWDIISNRDAISVNQDATEQGRRIWKEGDCEVWKKNLSGGKCALLLLNRAKAPASITIDLKEITGHKSARLTDIYTHKKIGRKSSYTVQFTKRDCQFIIVK
ncbi:MAG: glycoside hydrolase family 27 protein [Bacteroidales bacterium]|nr:glycoside hydrolase family 27 protein [Bacteroidales bacterium]